MTPGNSQISRVHPMPTLTTGALATEVLETTLLAVEDLTRRLTVLTLNAVAHPQEAPRLRALLSDLAGALERCEKDLGTY
jgi:hypothetical protein